MTKDAEVAIIPKGTGKKTLKNILYSLVVGGMIVVETFLWSDIVKEKKYLQRIKKLDEEISNYHYDQVLSSLNGLKIKDSLKLNSRIDLERKFDSLEALRKNEQFMQADSLLGEIVKHNSISNADFLRFIGFPENIAPFNEGVLLKHFFNNDTTQLFTYKTYNLDLDQKRTTAEKYLKMYPNGSRKKDVVEAIAQIYSDTLLKQLDEKNTIVYFDYSQAYEELSYLDSLTRRFSGKDSWKIDLSKIIPIKDLRENAVNMLSSYKSIIGQGSMVKVKDDEPEKTSIFSQKANNDPTKEIFSQEYKDERNRAFPSGSTGIVLNEKLIEDEKIWYAAIEFENRTHTWNRKWDFLLDYKEKQNHVAVFLKSELDLICSISSQQRTHFMDKLNKLESRLGR
jgi:hypothetical protein